MQERQEQKSTTEYDVADSLEPQMDAKLQRVQPHQMGASPPSTGRVCYLLTSSSNGCFDSTLPAEQIGRSIYRLPTADGMNGTFVTLDSSDTITTVMISASQPVKPVCRAVGSVSVYPRPIETVDGGSAVFEDGIWCAANEAVAKPDQQLICSFKPLSVGV